MTALDLLYAWMLDTLPWTLGSGGPVLTFPVMAIMVLVAARMLVWRILPQLLRAVITLGSALTVLLGVLLLGVEVLVSSGFRLCRLRPPALVYGLGDTLVAATRTAHAGLRMLWARSVRPGGLSGTVVLVLVIGLLWWWNTGYCARSTAAGCTDPVAFWLELVRR